MEEHTIKKQNYKCKSCGRQFIEAPQKYPVSADKKALIDRLLLEKILLAGIVRTMQVSTSWLQNYVNQKYQDVP